jgi:hypothetical protein
MPDEKIATSSLKIMMTELLQGSSATPIDIRKENGWYMELVIAETPWSRISSPKFVTMFPADYRHAIAVSIGGLTNK